MEKNRVPVAQITMYSRTDGSVPYNHLWNGHCSRANGSMGSPRIIKIDILILYPMLIILSNIDFYNLKGTVIHLFYMNIEPVITKVHGTKCIG